MKSGIRRIPVLTVSQYAYLFREGESHPAGGRTEEVADVFFVTRVVAPLKYRGLLLGYEKACLLSCVRNKNGDYHVSRWYKGERNTLHYDIMRPIARHEAMEFMDDQDERLGEAAKKAVALHREFRRLSHLFVLAIGKPKRRSR